AFWAENLLHTGGRNLIWAVVLACTALLVASLRMASLRRWRSSLMLVIVGIGVTSGLIGLLKQVTQVHCPWELQGFGGTLQYVHLFAQRPAGAVGACFPGAHSGSGFSLFALYFAFRDRSRALARTGLILALLVGCTFAFGQEARGAHFLSHDLWSAFIAWLTCLALYTLARRRLAAD
ncbi:MAG: phosphatase PAP2 family protein, partial [Steroidobacteraceae bacterium]